MALNYITEPSRKIPVIGAYDVVICGGGPSGIIAALSAARNGANTILIEQYGFLGGMATAALVGPISKFNLNGRRIVSGIPEEFINNLHTLNGAIIDLPSGNIPYDPEIYKYVAQSMLKEAGVHILLHSKLAGCRYDQADSLGFSHVLIENKSGRQAIFGKYFVDCTGTGDLIGFSSLPWKLRTNENGELQPLSLYFRIGGVDTSRLNLLMAEDGGRYANKELAEILNEEVVAGRLENFGGPWVVHGSTIRDGEVSVNATRTRGNAVDGEDLSNAEIKLREDVFTIWRVFKDRVPEFRKAYLKDTAIQVGIRETRTITGHYTMEIDDILTPRKFHDTVAMGGHPVDIHSTTDSRQNVNFITRPYHIPYRSIIPMNSTNLLVAGGTISATREAFASIRVQAQCMALGQAAGAAVALCKQQNISVGELDGCYLRECLSKAGAIV